MATNKPGFSLTEADVKTNEAIKIEVKNALKGAYTIKFQFPPRITGEDKNCNWEEVDVKSYEPIAIFMGSKARSLQVEFDYIVTDNKEGGWTAKAIRDVLIRLKSYAYNIGSDGKRAFPEVSVSWPNILPDQASCRLDGIGITYSNERVGRGQDVFPLKTTVKMTMKLATQISRIIPANQDQGKDTSDAKDSPQGGELPKTPNFKWF